MDQAQESTQVLAQLESGIRRRYPEWDQTPAGDPSRLLVEGLAVAMTEIGERQKGLINTMLSSIPSVLGFKPREALAPFGYVAVKPAASLDRPSSIEGVLEFRRNESTLRFEIEPGQTLYPIRNFSVSTIGTCLHVEFQAPASLSEVELFPTLRSLAEDEISAVVEVKVGGVDVGTQEILLSPSRHFRVSLVGRAMNTVERLVTVRCRFVFDSTPPLDLVPNAVLGRLYRRVENAPLGSLQGIPWEQVTLPTGVLRSPAALEVRYPDERRRTLAGLSFSDVTEWSFESSQKLSDGYFFNPILEACVLPGGNDLQDGYRAGVEVVARELDFLLEGWVEVGDLFQNRNHSQIENVSVGARLSGGVKRETQVEFGERFSRQWGRWLRSTETGAVRSLSELSDNIRNRFREVRLIEWDQRERSREIFLFLGTELPIPNPSGAANSSQSSHWDALSKAVRQLILAELPIGYRLVIQPFTQRRVILRCLNETFSPSDREWLKRKLDSQSMGSSLDSTSLGIQGAIVFIDGETGLRSEQIQRTPGIEWHFDLEPENDLRTERRTACPM